MKSISKMEIDQVLGDVFKEYRIKNNLTQENIAEKLGISVKYISRIENGTGGVKMETLVNYMNILGMTPNIVFDKLIVNEKVKPAITLSNKISNLSQDKIDFVISIIDLLNKIN